MRLRSLLEYVKASNLYTALESLNRVGLTFRSVPLRLFIGIGNNREDQINVSLIRCRLLDKTLILDSYIGHQRAILALSHNQATDSANACAEFIEPLSPGGCGRCKQADEEKLFH